MSLKKISYPILPSDRELSNKNVVQKELTNEELNERYYGHNNSFGFYPIGRLSSWHGGIHIEGSNCVRAIADGRIIAYRFAEDYLLEKDTQRKYSNSFILVQHNYESPGKQKNKDEEPTTQKLRFYSLYMHLMPKKELEKNNGKNIPDLYAKYTAKVSGKAQQKGLRLRSGTDLETVTIDRKKVKRGKVKHVLPKGTEVTYDVNSATKKIRTKKEGYILGASFSVDHWIYQHKTTYTPVYYKGDHDLFMATSGDRVKSLKDGTIIINIEEDIIPTSEKGAIVRKKPNSKSDFIRVEKKENDLGEIEIVDNEWVKIKGKEEYILKKDLKIKKTLKNDIVLNSVKNVDTSIKAGDIIGVPAQYSFEKQNAYNCVHLEVFTDDTEVDNFLKNHVGDDNQTTIEIPKGKTLQIAKPCNFFKKDTKVKILEIKDHYTQIGFETVTKDVNENLINFKKDRKTKIDNKNKSEYTEILKFEELNTLFDNALPTLKQNTNGEHESRLFYKSYVSIIDGVRKVFTNYNAYNKHKKSEKKKVENKKKLNKPYSEFIEYREITYIPKENKKYWVDNTEVVGNKNTWVTLTQDIKSYYEEEPKKTNSDIITTQKITARKISTTKDSKDIDWYNVQGKGKQKTNKGWIKKSDLIFINPYNWLDKSYGWEVFEDPDNNYFYHFGESFTNNTPKKFVNKVWEKLKKYDDDQNNLLTENELNNAMQKDTAVKDLSRLICKHFNEWDIKNKISDFNTEIDKVYEKGVNLATGEKKIKLEEARDAKKVLLEEKINNLCFWDQITDGDVAEADQHYNGKEKPEEKRTFPVDSSSIYHFHPIAFVEHMKLITAPTVTPGWNIDVHVWASRSQMGYGILILKDGAGLEYWRTVVRAQGYSSSIGGARNQQFADTPTGTYHFENWRDDGSDTIYGSNPRLDMTYESGEGYGNRTEIQIHGGRQEGETNPYLWNTGGCIRVFDDAVITLKKKITELEVNAKKEIRKIEVSNTLKFDTISQKYFEPSDFDNLSLNRTEIEKKGIKHGKKYRNVSNYYTDNIN